MRTILSKETPKLSFKLIFSARGKRFLGEMFNHYPNRAEKRSLGSPLYLKVPWRGRELWGQPPAAGPPRAAEGLRLGPRGTRAPPRWRQGALFFPRHLPLAASGGLVTQSQKNVPEDGKRQRMTPNVCTWSEPYPVGWMHSKARRIYSAFVLS